MNSRLRTYLALELGVTGPPFSALEFAVTTWLYADIRNLWQFFVVQMGECLTGFPIQWCSNYGLDYDCAASYKQVEELSTGPRHLVFHVRQEPTYFTMSFGNGPSGKITIIYGPYLFARIDRFKEEIHRYFSQ